MCPHNLNYTCWSGGNRGYAATWLRRYLSSSSHWGFISQEKIFLTIIYIVRGQMRKLYFYIECTNLMPPASKSKNLGALAFRRNFWKSVNQRNIFQSILLHYLHWNERLNNWVEFMSGNSWLCSHVIFSASLVLVAHLEASHLRGKGKNIWDNKYCIKESNP